MYGVEADTMTALATLPCSSPIIVRATEIDAGWRLPDDEDDCIPLEDEDLLEVVGAAA
jgi:hypothetical protein